MRGSGASTASWPRPATRSSRRSRRCRCRTGTACSRSPHGRHVPVCVATAAPAQRAAERSSRWPRHPPSSGGQDSAHTPAKGGIISFSRQLAVDAAADNVRVNVIAPGSVRTPLTAPVYAEDGEDDGRPVVPHAIQPRLGEPEEIAAAICFLLGRGELLHGVARGRRRRRDGDLTMAGLADPFSLGRSRSGTGSSRRRTGRGWSTSRAPRRRRLPGGAPRAASRWRSAAPASRWKPADRDGITAHGAPRGRRARSAPGGRDQGGRSRCRPADRTSDARRSARRRGTPRSRPRVARGGREPVAVRPLTLDEIGDVIQAFVRTSANVAEGGFDGVELHAAHGISWRSSCRRRRTRAPTVTAATVRVACGCWPTISRIGRSIPGSRWASGSRSSGSRRGGARRSRPQGGDGSAGLAQHHGRAARRVRQGHGHRATSLARGLRPDPRRRRRRPR